MQPRITRLRLGVDNLDKSVTFYRDGLGFNMPGIVGKDFVAWNPQWRIPE